jgi:hypothetical protein
MKRPVSVPSLLIIAVILLFNYSCDGDRYNIEGPSKDGTRLTIQEVKSIYQGKDVKLGADIDSINGTVISDASVGNIPKGILIIQEGATGIAIALKDSSKNNPFVPGDSVTVNIRGGSLVKNNGNLFIKGPSISDITKLGEGKEVKPTPVRLTELEANFDKYNETLVKVSAAEIEPEPVENETYGGVKNLSDGSTQPGAIKLYTRSSSSLAQEKVNKKATYIGIALHGSKSDSSFKALWPRSDADIKGIKLIPINSDVIITGLMINPRGHDQRKKGQTTDYPSTGTTIVHQGGYEYMQFMALKDIDFSKTPYCVVVANNRIVRKDGWAHGDNYTFKYNLTQGSVKKGEFFYVGSTANRLAGYYPTGLSADISSFNWIRKIKEGDPGDDGMGDPMTSLLKNGGTNADGVAIFKGTKVTSDSVPLDAFIWGDQVGGAYPGGDYGLQAPKTTDIYSRTNKKTGDKQPFLGQGTNTYLLPVIVTKEGSDECHFAAMGGVVSRDGKDWIVPRDPHAIELNQKSKPSEITSGSHITTMKDNE